MERYSVTSTRSGLLVAGPAVGFRPGELVELEGAPPADATGTPADAVAGRTVEASEYNWRHPQAHDEGGGS